MDAFEAFLRSPDTLEKPSLIIRCQFRSGSLDYRVVVDKSKSQWRLSGQFLPFLERMRPRLHGDVDCFVLVSDTMYVADAHVDQCVEFMQHAPFFRCDWLDADPVSSHAIAIPDFTIQDYGYAEDIEEIDAAALSLPFADRQALIKWRGRLTGPGFPDLENCERFSRYHLLRLAALRPDILDARLTYRDNFPDTPSGQALLQQIDEQQGGQADEIYPAEFASYKYLISLDGVTSTWKRVANSLRTGSVLILQHRWKQFFYPGLVAGEHYVPVNDDLSDLFDRYAWLRDNPEQAERIGRQGRRFAQDELSVAAIENYFVAIYDACAALPRSDG